MNQLKENEREEVLSNIMGNVMLLSRLWKNYINKNIEGEITFNQFLLIRALERNFKESPMISEVADMMMMTYQNVKKLAVQLESKGFLVLKKDTKDKRKCRLVLTDYNKSYWDDRKISDAKAVDKLFIDLHDDELICMSKDLQKLINTTTYMEGYKNDIN